MLGFKAAVVVYARVVEAEFAVLLMNSDVCVVVAGEELEWECAEFAVGANILDFVDDSSDCSVFVLEDLGDQVFIGKVLFAEVEMHCIASINILSLDAKGNIDP